MLFHDFDFAPGKKFVHKNCAETQPFFQFVPPPLRVKFSA
jgi:hypothetical protein